ncbi:MAG: nucleotide exchange factor GrpE [Lachnospiraceae bacterium]|nr:nucleotide exchange factor GrpE [Lachnospiraceae bacterium]
MAEEKETSGFPEDAETVAAEETPVSEPDAGETVTEETQPEEPQTEEPPEPEKAEDEAEKKVAELTDRLQRTMAEFENFRKRSEKEKAAMFEMGARSVIEKILPTVDNFERGLGSVPEEQKEDAFVAGMDKVYKHMMKELEELGVKPIEAVGKEFDPSCHNAVMHVEDENAGENQIVEEFQKGYTYRDSVVRYSMVKVAN